MIYRVSFYFFVISNLCSDFFQIETSHNMKGIVLAGGTGSRLAPLTLGTSKHLLPIYDKPMIYYPLSVLMLAKIKDVLIISNELFLSQYRRLFGTGQNFGMNISYTSQSRPDGIPSALNLGAEFSEGESVALILGDNIIYGPGLSSKLISASLSSDGATIFASQVKNPRAFGVVDVGPNGEVLQITEKPKAPTSNYAIIGLYFFDNQVFDYARNLKPSKRGETEVTDLLRQYLGQNQLKVEILGRGYSWFDAGTVEDLHAASNFVRTIQQNQGYVLGCLEEIAYSNGWISEKAIQEKQDFKNTGYYQYIKGLIDER